MTPDPAARKRGPTGFRLKLLVAMMLVVAVITSAGLYIAQRHLRAAVEGELEREFQSRLVAWQGAQDARRAELAELARILARKPRLHAALEDNALDLLYVSARDELRDVMAVRGAASDAAGRARTARFYRFLDRRGAVIPPPSVEEAGPLSPAEEAQLVLKEAPRTQHLGYLSRLARPGESPMDEIISVPIFSTETGETIAALVLGFPPVDPFGERSELGVHGGIWVNGQLHLPALDVAARSDIAAALARHASELPGEQRLSVQIGGVPHLLLHRLLNPQSLYPAAYEVYVFPLTDLLARQRQLKRNVLGAGALMLLIGLAVSHYAASRLAAPVEQLAVESGRNIVRRKVAEKVLEQTHAELQRAARFSADASHQLKTPVTVLRAGLEELLARETLPPEVSEEIAALVHQTHRLTGLIEDLLLLSRMDAGRLQLQLVPVQLSALMEAALDDLGAQCEGLELAIESDYSPSLSVSGETRYTAIILQNLLENARKYNHPGGRIRLAAREEGSWVLLTVGNTGRTIPEAAQPLIFDRFHRGTAGENIPGHGLGLNLARELARLHGGELRLVTSADAWTEFELRLRRMPPAPVARAA